jgi:hypothetical protein
VSTLVRYKIAMAGAALGILASNSAVAQEQGFSLSGLGPKPAAIVAAPVEINGNLRRIAADRSALFFNGESASNEYPFYALPSEIAGSAKLMLTLQTAISAAPERSQMRVFVNDQELGTVRLDAGDPHRVEFSVPSGLIQPGYNAVSILVDQKHRVDCTVDATYELWTQIDPDRSGFVFANASKPDGNSMPDLIALGGLANGRTPIRGHVLPGAPSSDINRTMAIVQSLALLGSFDHPAVRITNTQSTEPGIDVVVGTYSTVGDILGSNPDVKTIKDGISILSSADGKRKTLLVAARTAEDVDGSVTLLTAMAEKQQHDGTPQGLRALNNMKGRLLAPATQVPLRNLGFITEPFTGRFYSQKVNFSLPSDFYPGDYAALVLHLNAQYAAGLSKDAELIVRANSETVADITLGAGRNGLIKDQSLPIPLNKLRPGENTIQIEARLPTPSDAVCDPVASSQERPRMLILGDSYLEVPNFARVGRYPDIAALVSGSSLQKQANAASPLPVFVPNFNPAALDAAGSFLAKMAYSSGHVLSVDVTPSMPDARQPTMMAFGTYGDLPQDMVDKVGLDLQGMAGGLGLSPGEPGRAAIVPSLSLAAASALDTQSDAKSVDAAPADGVQARLSTTVGHLSDSVMAMKDDMASYASAIVSRLRVGANTVGGTDGKRFQPSDNAALLIAQNEVDAGGAWTIVTAPTNAQLSANVDAIMGRATWSRLNGSIQSFSASGQVVDEVEPTRVALFQTQAATVGNLRLVVAGWFSNHVWEYTLAQIGAAILLGISTFLFLKLGRGR